MSYLSPRVGRQLLRYQYTDPAHIMCDCFHPIPPFFLTILSTLLAIFLGALSLECHASDAGSTYYIEGVIEKIPADEGNVILEQFNPINHERTPVDTAHITSEGHYRLQYAFKGPDLFQVHFPGHQTVTIAVDEGQRDIQLNVAGKRNGAVSLTGSPDAQLVINYEAFRQKSYNRLVRPPHIAMTQALKAGDQGAEMSALEEFLHNLKIHRSELLNYTVHEIGPTVALYRTASDWTADDDVYQLEALTKEFLIAHPDLEMGKIMSDLVDDYKSVAVGSKMPDLVGMAPNGEMLDFRDAKGTFTLIDFWASWCRPCLLQVPHLKATYDTFAEKGFQIFGVSLDHEAEKWRAAIEQFELDWPQISDLSGWKSNHARSFMVSALPHNLLVNSDGQILAKNLHYQALSKKLEELF